MGSKEEDLSKSNNIDLPTVPLVNKKQVLKKISVN
jgi:hypothetical protein